MSIGVRTSVSESEVYKVIYKTKNWFIFSWWEEVKADRVSDDLHIISDNKYNNIYLNGEKIQCEQ